MLVPAIDVSHLSKTFGERRRKHLKRALADASFRLMPGEMVALIGASGSGKSTLLRLIAGLVGADREVAALVAVHGAPVQQGGHTVRDVRRRRREIGVVFQQFNLVDRLSVITNVLIGMVGRVPTWRTLTHRFTAAEKRLALEALRRVGIAEVAFQRASTLSGGQQQRAAIARTLVQRARIILADEPIASLDPESSRRVMELLARLNREDGITVLVSLHQVEFALTYCPRVIGLRAGEIVYDGPSAAVTPALLRDLYGSEFEPAQTSVVPERPGPRHTAGMPAIVGVAGN